MLGFPLARTSIAGPLATVIALGMAWLAPGCTKKIGPMPPVPASQTTATLAGPLCSGTLCTCVEGATKPNAGKPAPGSKRYEVRVGPTPNELWVGVGPHMLFKSRERPTECFYLDLLPGTHHVTIRGTGEAAFGAATSISEQTPSGTDWFETLRFACGTHVCSLENLKDWITEARGRGSKHDPCGSTKVASIEYRTGRLPDGIHPSDLFVELDLEVYKFTPTKAPCATP